MTQRETIKTTLENAKNAMYNLIELLGEYFVTTFETFGDTLSDIERIQKFITDSTKQINSHNRV